MQGEEKQKVGSGRGGGRDTRCFSATFLSWQTKRDEAQDGCRGGTRLPERAGGSPASTGRLHHDKGDSGTIPTSPPFSSWHEATIQLQREQRTGFGKSGHSSPLGLLRGSRELPERNPGSRNKAGLNLSPCQVHQQRHSAFLDLLPCRISTWSFLFSRDTHVYRQIKQPPHTGGFLSVLKPWETPIF